MTGKNSTAAAQAVAERGSVASAEAGDTVPRAAPPAPSQVLGDTIFCLP